MTLLKTYFNSIIKPKLLMKIIPKRRKNKSKRKLKSTPIKIRRVSTKRVFVGKGDLKHTNDKVILTFYIYSTEGMVLSRTYKKLSKGLFYPRNRLKETVMWNREKKIITYNRIFSFYEYLVLRSHYYWYISHITFITTKINKALTLINTYYEDLTNLVQINVLTENEKYMMFNDKVESFRVLTYPNYSVYLYKVAENYKKEWYKYIYLLKTYKLKFTNYYISKLNSLVNNMYGKKVVFNIVNLKEMHLNSDIYTQAVALKLRNKNNKLYKVLKSSLRKIKVKPVNKIDERRVGVRRNKPFLIDRVRNNLISSMLRNDNDKGYLSNLLLDFFPTVNKLYVNIITHWYNRWYPTPLSYYLKRRLKHMYLRGIRVEAKGRLTRRATASRSVFKMRYKGGLKNIESSFRGWSAIMLRGIVKSNVQYSLASSNRANGAFGVKGWVSSK